MASMLVVLVASAAVAGCGGDSTEPAPVDDEVRSQIDATWTALGSGDAAEACPLVAPAARQEIERPAGGVTVSCKRSVDLLSGDGETAAVAAEEFDSAAVIVKGSVAAARSANGWCAHMRLVDGTWLLALRERLESLHS